jgi:hypothetical protein
MLKNKTSSFYTILTLGLAISCVAKANNFPLEGLYQVENIRCFKNLPHDASLPVLLKIESDSRAVGIDIVLDLPGQFGFRPLFGYDLLVGSRVERVMGDGAFKRSGSYSNNGNAFTYTESSNSSVNPEFKELQRISLRQEGDSLTLEDSKNIENCKLIKIN